MDEIDKTIKEFKRASEADVEETRRLTIDLTEIHLSRQQELERSFRSSSRGELDAPLQTVLQSVEERPTETRRPSRKLPAVDSVQKDGTSKTDRFVEETVESQAATTNVRSAARPRKQPVARFSKTGESIEISASSDVRSKRHSRISIAPPDSQRKTSDGFTLSRPSVTVRELLHTHVQGSETGAKNLVSRLSWSSLHNLDQVDESIQQEFFAYQWASDENISQLGGEETDTMEKQDKRKLSHLDVRRKSQMFKERGGKGDGAKKEDDPTTFEVLDETTKLIPTVDSVLKTRTDFLTVGRANWPSRNSRIDVEAGFLYYPSTDETPLNVKIGSNEPHYLDEEGLYVGRPPLVVAANLRRLENRIVQESKSEAGPIRVITEQPVSGETTEGPEIEEKRTAKIRPWFNEDGNFALQPSPLRSVPQRPPVWDEQFNPLPSEFQVDYIPPMTTEMTFRYLALENKNSAPWKSMSWGNVGHTLTRRRHTGVGVITGVPECRLDVEIQQVVFDFHPLYTWEHVHAQNLRQVVMAYQTEMSRDQVNACIERLRALQRALGQLKQKRQSIGNANHENPAAIELDQKIEQYEQEISLIRRSRNHAEAVQRGLLASALRAWKRVKQARQLTGYTNTTVRLKITQELVDKNQEQNEWDKELDDIVEESRVLHEQKSKPLQQAYSEELAKYRAAKKRQATAMKRQRARESGKELDTEMNGATLAETEKEDARTLAEANLYKPPLPPAKFNAQTVRVQAEAQMVKSRRLPGEPKIAVSLSETTPVTLDSACPVPELLRRRDMSKYQYFVKLYFNHKYVEKTNLVSLSQDFTVNFAWTYPLHICHYPESILVKFFEKHGYRTREIAEFSLSPPELVSTDEHHPTEEQEQPAMLQRLGFTVTTAKQPTSCVTGPEAQSKCAVGSPALALIESLDGYGEYQTLLTENGQLIASTTWGPFSGEVQAIGRPDRVNFSNVSSYGCAGPVKPYNRFEELGQSDRPVSLQSLFTSRLGEFISESDKNALSEIPLSKLDPNDPADARLLSLVQALSGSQLSLGDAVKSTGTDVTRPHLSLTTRAAGVNYFRLDPLIKEFEFCDEKTLDQSRRFRLLQLRQAGVPQFRSIAVPIASKYIPSDVFIDYEERRRKKITKDATGMKAYRLRHQVYVEKIKSQVSQRFQEALRQKSYREVVIEEKIPNFFFILPLLRRLTEARRPLKVKRVERRPVAAQNVQNTGLQLLLTVHAAYNLPTRKMTAGTDQLGTSRRGEPIRPLVEVSFQNHLCTTSTSEGNNPSWNAELQLPFNFKGKLTPLEAVNDSISINVYDEVVIETDEGRLTVEPNSTVQRIERRLLGGFEVPFSTVYLNGKIDGKVPLTVPLVLQGYDLYSDGHASAKPMLHVFMALEPSVHPPEPLETSFTCTEPPEVLSLVQEWRQKLIKSKTLDPNQFNPLVMNTDCKQVVMTRYLSALNPPSELLPGTDTGLSWNESVLRLARYVSLIPYESDVAYFRGLPDLWCTSDQFLGMVCGDEEEHAVLLACYLLHLDQLRQTSETDEQNTVSLRVYLCIGEAVPEGQTVYVLTSEERGDFLGSGRKWKLWNPLRGQSFSVNNANGPMRSIYGIASAQNVWANIQPKKQPWELDWDLTSKKSWLPLFPVRSTKRKRKREVASDERPPLATVQPTLLIYDQLDPREVENIKFELEASLRDALMVWRRNKITRINYEYISDLSRVLENLEKHNGCPYDGLNKVLDRISSKYEVYGFPMNFPYAEIPVILERVKAKGIHNLLGSDSELDFGDSVNLFRTPRSMGDSRSSNQDSLPRQSVQSSLNNLQFALAVYVKAYPGPVLSIWVYLAALWRRIHTL